MRIGIDMLADQSAGRNRGTGRYVRGLLAELTRDSSHEFLLYYYDGLPKTDCTAQRKVAVRILPGDGSLHGSLTTLARRNPDRLDVLLLTCPLENFQGYLPPFPALRGPRLAAIVYDLIPLRYPSEYLAHPGIAQSYRRALAAVRHYDLLLSISESGRNDMIDLLRVPADRVVNIGAGSDTVFFCPADSRPSAAATARLARLGVTQPFLYALTALDYRKNFSGLLAAFDCLPQRIIDAYQFVVTCAASSQSDAARARQLLGLSRIGQRIVLTHSLDDVELRTLYQQAAAFVFPSRYEGFGLPPVEAMQCGAPVIAGRNSSQIEVLGDAGLLVDVDNPQALAGAIEHLLDDATLAQRLRACGAEQSRRFCWKDVAQRCSLALTSAVARQPRSRSLAVLGKGRWVFQSRLRRYSARLTSKSLIRR